MHMKPCKGSAVPVDTRSDDALYNEAFAIFREDDVSSHNDVEGLNNMFSCP
jgi:hypothetical protein